MNMFGRLAVLVVVVMMLAAPVAISAQEADVHVDLLHYDLSDGMVNFVVIVSGTHLVYVEAWLDGNFENEVVMSFPDNIGPYTIAMSIRDGGGGAHAVWIHVTCLANYTGEYFDYDLNFTYSIGEIVTVPSLDEEVEVAYPDDSERQIETYPWNGEDVADSFFGYVGLILIFGVPMLAIALVTSGKGSKSNVSKSTRVLFYPNSDAEAGLMEQMGTVRSGLARKEYGGTHLPELMEETELPIAVEVTGVLPVYSSLEDDAEWRVCQYCGEWTSGVKRRCINCGGRLGRPLSE